MLTDKVRTAALGIKRAQTVCAPPRQELPRAAYGGNAGATAGGNGPAVAPGTAATSATAPAANTDGARLVRAGAGAAAAVASWGAASSTAVYDIITTGAHRDSGGSGGSVSGPRPPVAALSPAGASATLDAFHSLSYVCEGLVFIYVGLDALDPIRWKVRQPARGHKGSGFQD